MVPTLAPHSAYQSQESHVPEDILCVIHHLKSQDGDARWFCERGAFVALTGAAAGVRVVVLLKATTACAASTTTASYAASTGSCNLCRHHQLNLHGLRAIGSRDTRRRAPHITLPNEGSEGGVQARWAVVGEEPELVTEVIGGDRGEGARLV